MTSRFDWATPTILGNNADPVLPTDAATKNYVDSQGGGVDGPNGAVQFNGNGEFTGSSGFTTDGANVTIGGNINGVNLVVNTSGNIGLNPGGNVVLFNGYINNLANPKQAQDAATKFYVDSVAQGLQVKNACQLATVVALPDNTYNNGVAGVGATLTASYNGSLTVDGVAVQVGDRVLVKDEATAANNGIYEVTATGDGSNPYVLTRSTDCDTTAEFNGAYTFVQEGDANRASGWICTASAANPVTVGTTPVEFAQFSEAGDYSAGNALSLAGTVFNVNVDGTSIDINPSNQLAIAEGVTLVSPVLEGATGDNITLSGDLSVATVTTTGNVAIGGGVQATANSSISANLQVTGTVAAGGVVTGQITGPSLYIAVTEPDADIIIDPTGGGNISVEDSYIVNLNNPVNPQDAATKAYVDAAIDYNSYSDANVAAYLPVYSGNIGGFTMDTIAMGVSAGQTNQGNNSVALGSFAGQTNQSDLGVAVGFYAGGNAQGTNTVAIGRAAAGEQQGNSSIAIGWQSAYYQQGSNAVAVGTGAGGSLQGNNAIAIGLGAGNINQVSRAIAIGAGAGQFNQGGNAIAIGAGAGNSGQNTNSIIINATGANLSGSNQGFYVAPVRNDNGNVTNTVYYNSTTKELTYSTIGGSSYANANMASYMATVYTDRLGVANIIAIGQGTSNVSNISSYNSISIGVGAGVNVSQSMAWEVGLGSNCIAIGYQAGQNPFYRESIAIGSLAGQNAQGEYGVAIGNVAGQNNQGRLGVAIGAFAGSNTQGETSIAIGCDAGSNAQGIGSVGIGLNAGGNSQGGNCVAIGTYSGWVFQGNTAVAIGQNAGTWSQGSDAVAIGYQAGNSSQAPGGVAVGAQAGNLSQGVNAVAVGVNAGYNSQSPYGLAVGAGAGMQQQGLYSTAVGMNAGYQSQGGNAIAIGSSAGLATQGLQSIAIGQFAGTNTQGANAVAIGVNAGSATQGANTVAIGINAGQTNQGHDAIAIGNIAGQTNQGNNSVSVGTWSGWQNGIGANSVAVGFGASTGNNSVAIGAGAYANAANSIVLNGSGASVYSGNVGALYVKPVRAISPATFTPTLGVCYNSSTYEVFSTSVAIGSRTNFNAAVGTALQFDNIRIAFPGAIPSPLSIQAVSSNFYATWSGPGITAGNGITIQQGASGWINVTTTTWTPLVQYSFEQTNDYICVVLANQSVGVMYRITGQLLSGTTWFGFIERLL